MTRIGRGWCCVERPQQLCQHSQGTRDQGQGETQKNRKLATARDYTRAYGKDGIVVNVEKELAVLGKVSQLKILAKPARI